MALIRCGSKPATEVTLWTNNNPTADFAGSNITLSESMLNFDLLEITFNFTKNSSEGVSTAYEPTNIKTYTPGQALLPIGGLLDNGSTKVRLMKYVSDTSINIDMCYTVGSSGYNNSQIIPVSIKGIKF